MHQRINTITLITIIFLLILSGCKLYKEPAETLELARQSLPSDIVIPEYWRGDHKDTSSVRTNWYQKFESDELNSLVTQALDTSNVSIIYYLAGIDAHEAALGLAGAGKKLQVNYGATYSGQTLLDGVSDYAYGAGTPISWIPDLWGRVKAGELAANENLLESIFNYEFTRQSITAKIAYNYFSICASNEVLDIADDFLAKIHEILEVLKMKQRVGVIDAQDIHLANSQLKNVESTILNYKNSIQLNTRQIEIMIGDYPGNHLQFKWQLDTLTPITKIENPITLIERRPDIKAKESQVRSLFYIEEQAKLLKYPNLTLTATPGVSNVGTLILGTGGSLMGPIFNGRAIKNQIAQADALQRQALASYGQTLLNAFNEVESNLATQQMLMEIWILIVESKNEVETAYELALRQYGLGKVGLFEVLNIQSQWLLKEIEQVLLEQQIYNQRVQLYLALGGEINL